MILLMLSVGTAFAHAQSFERATLSQDVPSAVDVTVADFDGDGDMDVATISRDQHLAFWIENQGQTNVTHTIWQGSLFGPCGITSGDFDGDDDVDIIIAAYGEDQFILLENVGTSDPNRFHQQTILYDANGAWSVHTGDVDGDNDLDLVTTEYRGNTVRILQNTGGQFTTLTAVSYHEPLDAVFADFDGDGDQDVVAASNVDPISWLEHGEDDQWTLHSLGFGANAAGVAVADLDGDGDQDIAATIFGEDQVVWWERNGSQFIEHDLTGNMTLPRSIKIADFNQDTRPDIIATSQGGAIRWWQNNGNRTFTGQNLTAGVSLYGMAVADIDWDSDLDVVAADFQSSEVYLYRNTMGIPAYLQGVVVSEMNGAGIAGVEVRLDELNAAVQTDASGQFLLLATEGDFTATARHPCWNSESLFSVHLARAETTQVQYSLVRGLIEVNITSINIFAPNGVLTETSIPVRNDGDGELSIHAAAYGQYFNDSWLSVEPTDMTIESGDEAEFIVQIRPDTTDNGQWDYYGRIELHSNSCPDSSITVAIVVAVLDSPEPPSLEPLQTSLLPAYPNPFNGTTTISFELARASDADFILYDVAGRKALTIFNGFSPAGAHQMIFSPENLASGLYILQMTADHQTFSQKLMLLK